MRALQLVAAGLLLGGAFALGRASAPVVSTVREVERAAPARPATGGCVAHLGEEDLGRLRAELMAALAHTAPAAPSAPTTTPVDEPAPSVETLAAEDAMTRHLDTALAAGHWTDDDAELLRGRFVALPPSVRMATLQRLSVAVNEGRLLLETTSRLPF